jgi:acyl-CoA reductase-like NAD-dependent aldehyde dehydrogenase
MSERIRVVSPADGRIVAERSLASDGEIAALLARARTAQASWRDVPLASRQRLVSAFVDAFESRAREIAEEISWQMGRPIAHSPGEIRGLAERARAMTALAPEALADVVPAPRDGFTRFVRRDPLGVVLVIAPWNYPYLTAVNAVVPAILAGNAVILRHSAQTPLCAERFDEAFRAAGLPAGVFQVLHCGHESALRLVASDGVDFVAFTGSVDGGHAVQRAAATRFIGVGLELGGCDPVYVRHDADVQHAIENIVDGAYFNSGQSCCGLQRVYVHERVYGPFVDGFVELTRKYALGNPLEPDTTLGPVVRTAAAETIRGQIEASIQAGAKAVIDEKHFPASRAGTPYLAPQVLLAVDHSTPVMKEEIFGPVAGIMRVRTDEEAVELMNDSAFGLTAAIWTSDEEAALAIGDRIETGTWFMNRCDYLDPALAWVGVKDSGRGCTLSVVGYEHLTRPKSFHLRLRT